MHYGPKLVFIQLLTCMLAAARGADAPATNPSLDAILWKHDDLHARNELTLRADGTYRLVDSFISYSDAPSPGEALVPHTTTETIEGKWQPLGLGPLVMLFGDKRKTHPEEATLMRLFQRGDSHGFDRIAERFNELDARDEHSMWLKGPRNYYMGLWDMGVYSDEKEVTALLGVEPLKQAEAEPELAKAVRASLPKDWTLTCFPDAMVIAREGPVRQMNGINVGSASNMTDQTVDVRYAMVLRFEKLMTADEVNALVNDQAALEKRLETMREGMNDIGHMFDRFSPRGQEEQQRVDAYEKAKKERRPIPAFQTQQHTGYITYSINDFGSIPQEVKSVQEGVLKLLEHFHGSASN